LVKRIQKNLPTEIYAANPFSPNVEARLIEEETGDDTPEIRIISIGCGKSIKLLNTPQNKDKRVN